jgi:serine/threonine protein kinase/tetratricopeptide (TPR) repeat protein
MATHSTNPSSSSRTDRPLTTYGESTKALNRPFSRRALRAHRLPDAGQSLGEFRLLAELGRGAAGRVYLAQQAFLAGRLIVLKVTPSSEQEHVTLARLQHTHIVPLYSARDFPERNLRCLCMPCLGGATLRQLFRALRPLPPARRTGRDLLDALQASVADPRLYWESPGPNRRFLEQATYVQAACWLGVCLADALQYAHEHGLVHLDVKPSNVLLTADCEPMLLDFHVARGPILPHQEGLQHLGGTTAYMSPEQHAALLACHAGMPVTIAVDGRSDVYALGLLLCEFLYGQGLKPAAAGKSGLLPPRPGVTVGLRDVLARCLCPDPAARYPSAAMLADDLRRHLTDRPLAGVRNRSPVERWRKWRRRRPNALVFAILLTLCLGTAVGFAGLYVRQASRERHDAEAALVQGLRQLEQRHFAAAVDTCDGALERLGGNPNSNALCAALLQCRQRAARGHDVAALHRLLEHSRYVFGDDQVAPATLQALHGQCRSAWKQRDRLLRADEPLDAEIEESLRRDLLDAAILWADLQVRLAPPDRVSEVRREALEVLDEAEARFGISPVLCRQRRALGRPGDPGADATPRTAWEHFTLGRWLLQDGKPAAAAVAFAHAVELRPQDFWPWFGKGLCAHRRGRADEAVTAFSVCIALAPESAPCYHNRALALAARGDVAAALDDCNRALRLDPQLGAAALNRGALHFAQRRLMAAEADFECALRHGANPAAVHYNQALVHQARQEPAKALASLDRALQHDPRHGPSRQLRSRIEKPMPPGNP